MTIPRLAQRRSHRRPRCKTFIDTNVAANTQFPHAVTFELGKQNIGSGDRIEITDVHGTRASFEKGGIYLVKGEYTSPRRTMRRSFSA